MATKAQKDRARRIEKLASAATFNNPCPVMKLGEISKLAGYLLDNGLPDEQIVSRVAEHIRSFK